MYHIGVACNELLAPYRLLITDARETFALRECIKYPFFFTYIDILNAKYIADEYS